MHYIAYNIRILLFYYNKIGCLSYKMSISAFFWHYKLNKLNIFLYIYCNKIEYLFPNKLDGHKL